MVGGRGNGRVGGQAKLEAADFVGQAQQGAHGLQGNDQELLVGGGVDAHQRGGVEPHAAEGGGGAGERDAGAAAGVVERQRIDEMGANPHFARQRDAHRRLRQRAVMQRESAVDYMLREPRLRLVDGVDALRAGQLLPSAVAHEHLLLDHAADLLHARIVQQRVERGPGRHKVFAGNRRDQHVRRQVGETLLDDAVETVVDGENENQCGRADGHPDGAQRGNRVDDAQRLPGHQVTPRDIQLGPHKRKTIS